MKFQLDLSQSRLFFGSARKACSLRKPDRQEDIQNLKEEIKKVQEKNVKYEIQKNLKEIHFFIQKVEEEKMEKKDEKKLKKLNKS